MHVISSAGNLRRRLEVSLAALATVVSVMIGRAAGRGQAIPYLGLLPAAVLLVVAHARPWTILGVIYPLTANLTFAAIPIGPLRLAPERLFASVSLFGFGMALYRRQLRLPPVSRQLIGGVAMLLGSLGISLVLNFSTAGLSAYSSLVQKILFGYLTFISVWSVARLRMAARLYIVAFAISAVLAVIWIVATGDALILRTGHEGLVGYGTLLDYSFEAAQVVIFGGIAVWFVLIEARLAKTTRKKWALIFLAGLLLTMSSLSVSRVALILAPIMLVMLLFYRRAKMGWAALILLAVLVSVFLWEILPHSRVWQDRLLDETLEALSTGREPRVQLIQVGWLAFQASPLIGHGLGSFSRSAVLYSRQIDAWRLSGMETVSPHNVFVGVAAESGIVGLIGMMFFLYTVLRQIQRGQSRAPAGYLRAFVDIAPLTFLHIMFLWMSGGGIHLNISWFWFGLLMAAAHLAQHNQHAAEKLSLHHGRPLTSS